MKTAILVHGHHLFADKWEDIVWGSPKKGVYGRAAAGLREALRQNAEIVFFPTGSSKKDGLTDGEYALKVARERISELPEFSELPEEKAREWLEARAITENTSQTTAQEVVACGKIAVEKGIERLILVSSPTHVSRALKTALAEFSKNPQLKKLLPGLMAIASDVSYPGFGPEDVLIIEPPHRGDDHRVLFGRTLKDVLRFSYKPDLAAELNEALKRTIAQFTSRL